MASDPLDDYLEKTFADAYRREMDQQENVWRSLPFFAASLALLLAALAAAGPKLAAARGPVSWALGGLLAVVALSTLVAIIALAKSVAAADFWAVASETTFLRYADLLRASAGEGGGQGGGQNGAGSQEAAEAAAIAAKRAMMREYAVATERNRSLNHRRESWRTWAALALLLAVLMVLILVGVTVTH